MTNHFFVHPGEWTGQGSISFTKGTETIPFTVHWSIEALPGSSIKAIQKITIEGETPHVNTYTIRPTKADEFELFFENKDLGIFSGKGVFSDVLIAWEFAHFGVFEGMEVYHKKEENIYDFTAQYSSGEDYITKISGTVCRT